MRPVPLRTERLVLDQPGPADVDLIAEYCRDPLFERYLPTPWPYRREHAVGFVEEFVPSGWAADRECTWAIRSDAEFLGVLGLSLGSHRERGTIGFWLGAPHRGFGYLPEAARAVIDWAFASELVDSVAWEAVIPNRSSLSVARGLGFSYTGEGPAEVAGRDVSTPLSWHAELSRGDDRALKPGWP